MLHIKIIQALDTQGAVVLAKNVNIMLDSGDALEIVYKVIKHGGAPAQKITMDSPAECAKDVKEFDTWLTELPEQPSNGKE